MPERLLSILAEFWNVLGDMSPYLLFGFFVAGILSVYIPPELVERHLGGGGPWPLFKASLFGVPLPLCSCGVIPVAASLRRHGASRPATTAFLLSTPQTGADSVLVTFSLLGPVFAVFRPLAAFASGLIGGGIVAVVSPREETEGRLPTRCEGACCSGDGGRGRLRRALGYGFGTLPRDIGRALVIGLVVAGIITALVPKQFFAEYLGRGTGAMLVMMAAGIPVYVCATASVPVAAALIAKGVTPGAALVFLMTGPATNAATVATVWRTMGGRTAAAYLFSVAGTALGSGLLLDYVFKAAGEAASAETLWMLPWFVKYPAAIGLLAVLGVAFLKRFKGTATAEDSREREEEEGMQSVTLEVVGMTCEHCVRNVRRALESVHGVASVTVELRRGEAGIHGPELDVAALSKAVKDAGYEVARSNGPSSGKGEDS